MMRSIFMIFFILTGFLAPPADCASTQDKANENKIEKFSIGNISRNVVKSIDFVGNDSH